MTELIGSHPSRGIPRTFLPTTTLIAMVLVCAATLAQKPPRSHRDAAIALGEEGLALLEQGEHAAALRKFDAADELIPAPTFGVRAALCLERMGRLVDALERYERVAAIRVDASWPEIHTKAQQEARTRAETLRMRVARLRVVLQGESAEPPTLKLDGNPLSEEASAATVLLDPGEHVLEFAHGTAVELRRFRVAEGEQRTEGFLLGVRTEDGKSTASPHRTLGWVGVAVGAAGMVVGSTAGLVAWGKKADLESRCPAGVCPPVAWADNESYDRWRNASTAGFAVGTVALGLGTLLLLTDPGPREVTPQPTSGLRVQPWIGAASAGVGGAF